MVKIILAILFMVSSAWGTVATFTTGTSDTDSNFVGMNTAFDQTQSYNLLGYSATPTYHKSGIRFQSVTVTAEATIASCTLVVNMAGTGTAVTVDLRLYGELSTDALPFTTEANFDGRTPTTTYADFSIGTHTDNEVKRISINPNWLQEIVCQGGYSGSATTDVVILLHNNGSTSGETKSIKTDRWGDPPAASLVVVYTAGGGCAAATDTLASCQIDSLKNDISAENDSIKLVYTTKSTAGIDSVIMAWSTSGYPDSSTANQFPKVYVASTTDSTKIYVNGTETYTLYASFWNKDAGIYSTRQQRSRIFTAASPPATGTRVKIHK